MSDKGVCASLSPVGLRIWQMLEQRYSTDQMADFVIKASSTQLASDRRSPEYTQSSLNPSNTAPTDSSELMCAKTRTLPGEETWQRHSGETGQIHPRLTPSRRDI